MEKFFWHIVEYGHISSEFWSSVGFQMILLSANFFHPIELLAAEAFYFPWTFATHFNSRNLCAHDCNLAIKLSKIDNSFKSGFHVAFRITFKRVALLVFTLMLWDQQLAEPHVPLRMCCGSTCPLRNASLVYWAYGKFLDQDQHWLVQFSLRFLSSSY